MRSDLGLRLLTDGYRAIPRARRRAGGRPVFPVRLLGRPALVVAGPESVRRFYDDHLIRRRDAVPPLLSWLLFGRGAIHGLDGEEHAHRKQLFLELLDDRAAAELGDRARELLAASIDREKGRTRPVFDLLVEAYGAAVLGWAGIGAAEPAVVSRRLAAIVDGFGGAGTAYARAWLERLRMNRWAARLVRLARADGAEEHSPLDRVARWRDHRGELLPERVAAVELLNVLRPAVAVAYLGAFAVLALDEHPRLRARVAGDASGDLRDAYVQEVRRVFPFVPALAGRTRTPTSWGGHDVRAGQRVILDVPGTNHDEKSWTDPGTFDPDRFVGREVDPYELVPQGGGHVESGHRCPGEPATLALLAATVDVFARCRWEVVGSGHSDRRIPARERLSVVVG